jgi:hypothetical protein
VREKERIELLLSDPQRLLDGGECDLADDVVELEPVIAGASPSGVF